MSNQQDYEALLDAIMAIPAEETKSPTMPMENIHQEGDNLSIWCKEDQEKLLAAGISQALIDTLGIRVGASRESQSRWNSEFNSRKGAEKKWVIESPFCFDLRDMLNHSFRYAFRDYPDLLSVVDRIAEGNTREDMIQDLNDLALLGKANVEKLNAISFDIQNLDLAASKADEMGELLAAVNGDRDSDSPALVIRNKAYTYLKNAMDEIRLAGKYVFWKDKARLKGYSSAYYRKFS